MITVPDSVTSFKFFILIINGFTKTSKKLLSTILSSGSNKTYQHLPTWIFDVELLLLAKEQHMPVAEVPIEWHEVSGSKLHVFADSLQMLRDLLILRANILLGRWKVPAPETATKGSGSGKANGKAK